jgi:hypothetical protein
MVSCARRLRAHEAALLVRLATPAIAAPQPTWKSGSCCNHAELDMSCRDWMRTLVVLWIALPDAALAASFGSRATAVIAPVEGGAGVHVTNELIDVRPTTTWAWLADGASSAAAGTPFGANHAAAISTPGVSAHATSIWTETYTINSIWGATGSAAVSFELMFAGVLDAGSAPGGSARMTLRALTGTGEDAADSLLPREIAGNAEVSLVESCAEASPSCGSEPVPTRGALVLAADFEYGAPFRFAMLLESSAAEGGRADFAPSAWLERILLPDGAVLRSASGWEYGDVEARVPEPGTIWLLALGLAACGGRRALRLRAEA